MTILRAWFVASDGTQFDLDISTLTVQDDLVSAKLKGGQSYHNFKEQDIYFLESSNTDEA